MTNEFTFNWTLDASAADVFQAWTDPDHLDWFYNDEQPRPSEPIEVDLRVGGVWRQLMVIDADTSYFTGGVYREIVPEERLVFSWGATGGWPELDPERLEDSPLVTVTLTRGDGRTEMFVHVELPESFRPDGMPEGWFDHVQIGWRDTVDRLAAQLTAARAG
ncbi:MAG TPA: SRPBCC domain-containing protein [Gaiellaceae bacterium]